MEEQGFKNEFDEYDEMVPHAVLFMEGCAVATGRLLPGERSGDFINITHSFIHIFNEICFY